MKVTYETSEVRQRQVDMAALGTEIFTTAVTALTDKTPPGYEQKPLDCLVFDFTRVYPQSFSTPDETILSEKLRVSLTNPKRLDEYDYTGREGDIFVFPTMTDGVKNIITQEICRATKRLLGTDTSDYRVPACATTTAYSIHYKNGQGAMVDSTDYKPLKELIISGHIFAQDVMQYMQSEVYRKFPAVLPEIEKNHITESGGMLHSAKISFAARPPLNGKEPKFWLEKYAKWLQESIKEMTFGPESPKTSAEFTGIADSAMDDGIILMQTLDMLHHRES